jgi:biotin transport system substrate-specific component
MFKNKLSTREICFIGLFTALTAVMAQISIPMPLGVPMTMQTFAISMAGMMLGARNGFLSILIYILLGAAGMPVFANFSGGLGIVLGPTGGFILTFPIMAWMIGLGAQKRNKLPVILGLFAGTVFNYAGGTLMFSVIAGKDLQTSAAACVLPFIPTAVIKAAAAGALGFKIMSVKWVIPGLSR